MFKNEYQGGAFVEIFSAQGKNPGAKWKIVGSPSVIWKEFDKEVKSFVFVLEGSSQTNKIQLPRENKQILGLIQRFLVLQIYIPLGQDFSTELLITDLGNIKRRLYLSTVHKELSSTPLHAKIPLFMIRRKIWCNLCIDLVAFTSEIFKGAVFQSLDGIIVSANCKLRKIFTLKCKPQDTADKDAGKAVPFPTDEPTDIIPRSCQLTTDVPQVTQLLNMTKLRQTEIKFGGHPLSSAESADLHVMHPHPPQEPSADKNNNRRRLRLKSTSRERTEAHSGSSSGNNRNEDKATAALLNSGSQQSTEMNSSSPAPPSPDQTDEWIFPENHDRISHLASRRQSLLPDDDSCHTSHLWLEANRESEHGQLAKETQVVRKDIFTFSSRPRSAPHGKTQNMSPEGCPFILDLKEDISMTRRDTESEEDFYGGDSSEEERREGSSCIKGSSEKEYDWRNYQPSQMSESELQMLASLRRQQNEELEDTGASHGLSASQVDNCNVSISTSSDDTTTWNSCLPPPVNQGRHYQKEMNPPSPSNPRDWLNMLSPPILPSSRQPTDQHPDSSGSLSAQGEEDPSVEEDEEVLTLLYDPCLNCYFDPQTGKYYELV
ncbi:protein CFAP20DC isoform X6 [Vulpes lagopus]|uniref:protein CFAP20DC isoform X6 n=1 Tax=Vulpes lagopus TaxID=494514 RepID=UPI001BC948B1|nr:protein CFAP20DC isoform X6 [Vulpes lagopus]